MQNAIEDGGFLLIFYAEVQKGEIELEKIKNEARRAEIAALKNAEARKEKFSTWRLLEYAVKCGTGSDLNDLCPRKTDTGKWVADGVYLSLSHSRGAVAVCVSDRPCGVDIEELVPPRAKNFAKKALTEREIGELEKLPDAARGLMLTELWSKKESLFKKSGAAVFSPKNLDTVLGVRAVRVTLAERQFVLSFASENLEKATVTEV